MHRLGLGLLILVGRFVMVNLPVVRLIRAAYPNLTAAQVSGVPGWVNTERYDITATAGRDVTATEMERLLRRLLLDRFGFMAHSEYRDQDAFALIRVSEREPVPARLQRARTTARTWLMHGPEPR